MEARRVHSLSIIVPVYQGERALEALVSEVEPLTREQTTAAGHLFQVQEMILVYDGALDRSDEVMRALEARFGFVKLAWLSRNFGQHAATIAGMASTSSEWVVTLDEDGQHNPTDVATLLDVGLESNAQLVYARPTNEAPHGFLRNLFSATAKGISRSLLGNSALGSFHSFRLIKGEIARGLAAYCGERVYLDVALSWVVGRATHCPVALRLERGGRRSGYTLRRLVGHFWQLVLTSGTRPLRLVSLMGVLFFLGGIVGSAYAIWAKLTADVPIQGWTSLLVVVTMSSGLILLSLGTIAEYLGVVISMAMGKPLYLVVTDPGPRPKK
jgi:undecaprenyl-phosphate 4-deoxy-4-formamido-L-arabinose transferase